MILPAAFVADAARFLQPAAALAIACAGMAFLLKLRRLSAGLLITAFAAAAISVAAARIASAGIAVSLMDGIAAGAMLAAVFCCALGHRRIALALAAVPLWHWMLTPLLFLALSKFPVWLEVLCIAPFAGFIAIWLLQGAIGRIYGDEVGAHVAGTYLVRLLDGIGRGIGRVLSKPFRLSRRR
jgi:hypothetical protein